jgi:hypothetical protein
MKLLKMFTFVAIGTLILAVAGVAQTIDVYGQVRIWSGSPSWGEGVNGVTVMLYDYGQTVLYTDITHTDNALMVQLGLTSPDGFYYFDDVPERDDYWVEIIPPDGFVLATNPEQGSWWNANPRECDGDFYNCFLLLYESHTIGFWGANAQKIISGKGNTQVTPEEYQDYLDEIFDRFNGATYFPIEGVSCVGGNPLTVEDADDTFNLPNGGPSGMVNKAKKQLLAVLLDVAAGWTFLDEVVSNDWRTGNEAVAFGADMITNNGDEIGTAKDVLDYINNNLIVPSGWIPDGYESIIYGGEAKSIANVAPLPADNVLISNYPNPFNPETNITFTLPEAANTVLAVYNLQGQQVAELLNSTLEAGRHAVSWNAANLPSGMYVYRLTGNFGVVSGKMLLMK